MNFHGANAPRPEPRRALAALAVVFFAAGCAASVAVWNARTQPVFAHRPHPVTAQAVMFANPGADDDLLAAIPAACPLFVISKLALAGSEVTYPRVAAGQPVLLALLVIVLAGVAWRIGGARAAVAAAAIAAATPVVFLAAIGFDDHLTLMLAAATGLLFLAGDRPFARLWPAIGAGFAICAALRFAFVSSSGLVAASVVGACAGARFVHEVFATPSARRGATLTHAVVGVALMAAVVFVVARRDGGFAYLAPSYLGAEAGHAPPGLARNLLAYPYLMGRYHLGPIVTALALVGMWRAVDLWRAARERDARAIAVAVACLAPLAVLVAIPKKNPYYLFALLTAAPVLGGFAWSRMANSLARTVAGVFIALGIGLVQWGLWRGDPEARPAPGFEDYIHEPSSFALHRPDDREHPDRAEALRITEAFAAIGVKPPATILVPGSVAVFDELRYFLLAVDPRWRLYVALPAASPPMREPVAVLREAGERADAPVGDAIEATARMIEEDERVGTDHGGRPAFLRRLAHDVPEWRRIHRSERYVVDVPEFVAAAAATAGP
ncbi:MAG: hypothetical protein IT350_16605 [Deltaproteobacteria bacterium]|nr:hypothetical protein [Deltaproteobacteria bacterium]